MVEDTHTISMASCKYNWDEIDRHAKKHGLKRSEYLQQLVEKDFNHKKTRNKDIVNWVIMLLCIITIILLLVVII